MTPAAAGGKAKAKEPRTSKASAALAEREAAKAAEAGEKPPAKSVEFHGLTLALPDELPDTLLFDIVEIEASGTNPIPLLRFLRSLLGPEQFVALRNVTGENANGDAEAFGNSIAELVADVFAQYGVTPGESEASQGS